MSAAAAPQQPMFNIEKLYVKDISLEIPHAPEIFLERESPQIDFQLHSKASTIGDGIYEVAITVTVTAKLEQKDKVMFLIEATQAGIFRISNMSKEDMDPVLGVGCPNILYPYIREVVSDVSVRAGFAPVVINPINFDLMYQQKLQQQQAEAVPATTH
ncbi:MAG: protein-export chaperone SecB [Nitrosomonadales bacterium]|nr:protein-export chaperone SecB [Nitrosomonadales bacterium]